MKKIKDKLLGSKMILLGLLFLTINSFSQSIQNGNFEIGPPVTDHGQIHLATGWWGAAGYYGMPLGMPAPNISGSSDLFEVGANCARLTPTITSNVASYDIPNNKWATGLSAINGTHYAGAGGAWVLNGLIDSTSNPEIIVGTIIGDLKACATYEIEFMHAPASDSFGGCGLRWLYPPNTRRMGSQQMWVKLRIAGSPAEELLIAQHQLNPSVSTWDTYSFDFSLTETEASMPWDRIEFVVVNPVNQLDKTFFLDNVSLEVKEEVVTTYDILNFYQCTNDCYPYQPGHKFEFDGYILTVLSGPNDQNYNSDDGMIPGAPASGWGYHCLFPGNSYQFNFYNRDGEGDLTCLTKSLVVNVANVSVECAPDQDVTLCPGECVTIGSPNSQEGTYKWLDLGGTTSSLSNRIVCPTASTTYQLEFTNEFGCVCTTNYNINLVNELIPPLLLDDEICLGEEYCIQFSNLDFVSLYLVSTRITFDFGDGEVRSFNMDGPTVAYPDPNQCHTYGAEGPYEVTVTFETPCGTFTATSTVLVNDLLINNCGVKSYNQEGTSSYFYDLPEILNLEDIYLEFGNKDCCEGQLLAEGVWRDAQGNEIPDPTIFGRDLLLDGDVTKEYIDLENCTKCVFTVVANSGSPNSENDESNMPSSSNNQSNRLAGNIVKSEIGSLKHVNFKLAPNPSAGNFQIANSNSIGSYEGVRILSVEGKVIVDLKEVNSSKFYDLGGNRDGIYFIEITSGESVQRLRLVLQN